MRAKVASAEDHLSTLPHEFLIEHISDRSRLLKLLRLQRAHTHQKYEVEDET